MRGKIIFIIGLTIFSFLNNIIFAFDEVQNLTLSMDVMVFIQTLDPRIESEDNYFILLFRYIIFFIFFFNITDVRSVLKSYQL